MKRGILFALQAAGVIAVCLAASLNHPVHALGTASMCDTAYYFNESGKLIYSDTTVKVQRYFVIKTCQTKEQLFYDMYKLGVFVGDTAYKPADVDNITKDMAMEVERLIISGKITETLVQDNTIPLHDRVAIRRMYDTIPDSGKNNNRRTDFREYGGYLLVDKSLKLQRGKRSDPCYISKGIKIDSQDSVLTFFHSHPSGEKKERGCAFIQAPSMQDQEQTDKGVSYVFGMNKRSHLLYIINARGIQATLPFCWFLCCSVNK